MASTWSLDILPNDVLFKIFDYCDAYDLIRLGQTCKRLNEFIHLDTVWTKKSKKCLVTNQVSKRFRERCSLILNSYTAWRVSNNWKYGVYKKYIMCTKPKIIPWIRLTNDEIWWSCGSEILCFSRKMIVNRIRKGLCNHYYQQLSSSQNDIYRFLLWKNYVICSYRDGSITYFLKSTFNTPVYRIDNDINTCFSSIRAIDATSEYVISSNESGLISMQRHPMISTSCNRQVLTINGLKMVKSLSVDPTETKFAVGSCGTGSTKISLHVVNIERYKQIGTMQHQWKHGAGILDMVWDDPHTLLTCGYDTYIRKWDLRTQECVCSWEDPTDAALYCLSSDHRYTMVTGTQYNCLAVLWDQRKTNFVQLYYVNPRTSSTRSPIYSIQFDNTHLYCATDQHLITLDFLNCSQKNRFDYKSLYIGPS